MLKKIICIAISLIIYTDTTKATEEVAMKEKHAYLLKVAREGDIEELEKCIPTANIEELEKHKPTANDVRELFNAAFINKQWEVMKHLWKIPDLSDPVDYENFNMNIDYPQTTVPYTERKGFDDLNDIFSYNICSRTAFCHIYTPIPNTYELENNRWQHIFDFFKVAESAEQDKLIQFIVKKAYLYHKPQPNEQQKWLDFMREKATSEKCNIVEKALI